MLFFINPTCNPILCNIICHIQRVQILIRIAMERLTKLHPKIFEICTGMLFILYRMCATQKIIHSVLCSLQQFILLLIIDCGIVNHALEYRCAVMNNFYCRLQVLWCKHHGVCRFLCGSGQLFQFEITVDQLALYVPCKVIREGFDQK